MLACLLKVRMKYKKQICLISVGIILVMLMLVFVNAQTEKETKISAFDLFLSNLKYKISNLLFTSVGQARDCSVYPNKIISHSIGEQWDSYDYRDGGCSDSALINTYYDDFFYREYEDDFTEWDGLKFDENTWIEFYCCPYPSCDSNSDCDDPYGDICNIAYGSCYYEEPDWETDVYRCEETGWEFWQDVDYGSNYWCNDPDRKMWYHPGHDSRQCYEDEDDAVECVLDDDDGNGDGVTGDADFQVDIISATPIVFSSEQNVNINVKIKNNGEKGSMKVEVGLYKDEDITSWGFVVIQDAINCEPNEKNVDTKLIELNAGEEITETFTIITPKVCRKGIEPIGTFDLLVVAFVNCFNTGLATGVTSSDRFNVAFTPRIDCVGSCTNGIRDGEETDTDCGGSECYKCRNGWTCERTTDCQSGLQCLEGYCSSSDTSRGNQKGISASKIKKMTAEDLAASACTKTIQCEEESECQSLQFLVDSGSLTDEEAESIIDRSAIFFTSAGAIGGIAACGAASLVLLPAAPILFPLCALAGGALGLGINDIFESFGDKDLSKAGYCIKEGVGLEIFEWAAFFDVTGDGIKDGTDGLIIVIIGGALLLILVLKR